MFLFSQLGLLLSSCVMAEQTLFERQKQGDVYRYQFAWLDNKQQAQSLEFDIPTQIVNNAHRHFKALRPSLLQIYSERKLRQTIAKSDRKKGKIQLVKRHNSIEFKISSSDEDWLNKQTRMLNQVYEESLTSYLKDEYYIEFSGFSSISGDSTSYKPDHVRFAQEDGKLIEPIVAALKKKFPTGSARKIAQYILPWLQSIPYNTMESRADSNGAGFLPPIKVINQNQGDCDSKVTLMASILKKMYPRLRIALVFIPQHALIGLNTSHVKEDEILQVDGFDFVLSEPVGPAQTKFAEISDSSKRYIDSGYYQVEIIGN